MISAIVYDFDGVIAESVDVKTRAFKEIFKNYPEKVKAIEQFHLENGGMSRFDKFRHIYAKILKKELCKEEFDELCRSFQKLVIDEVVKSPFVGGAKEFLDFCLGKYPMYVVSGTPVGEMREIIRRKRLDKYFHTVYGSPDSKAKSIRIILSESSYSPSKVLFIGDSKNDYVAARETGLLFALRITNQTRSWVDSEGILFVFSDLNELKEQLIMKVAKQRQQ